MLKIGDKVRWRGILYDDVEISSIITPDMIGTITMRHLCIYDFRVEFEYKDDIIIEFFYEEELELVS